MFVNRRRAAWIAGAVAVWPLVLYFLVLRPVWHRSQPRHCSECASPVEFPTRVGEAGFTKLGPPRPGDWRWSFKEREQTFENYIAGSVNRKCAHQSTIYLQPLGNATAHYRETLDRMRAYSEAFFGVSVKILDPLPMFDGAYHDERNQYDATKLIDALADRVPPDALAYMGITEQDLYSSGLNFVFGQGSLHRRCGVYSLHRFETGDAALFLRRSLKLLSHEAGHILSIEHCTVWSCVMQGVNSLEEDDRNPLHLCPVDLRKVLWNTGAERDDRYRRLRALYREWGLNAEADWVGQRLGSN